MALDTKLLVKTVSPKFTASAAGEAARINKITGHGFQCWGMTKSCFSRAISASLSVSLILRSAAGCSVFSFWISGKALFPGCH